MFLPKVSCPKKTPLFSPNTGIEHESKVLCKAIIYVDNVDNFVDNVNRSHFLQKLSTKLVAKNTKIIVNRTYLCRRFSTKIED